MSGLIKELIKCFVCKYISEENALNINMFNS